MGRQARLKATRRLVPAAMKAIADTGLPARVNAVRQAVRGPVFDAGFRSALACMERIAPASDLEAVRGIALRVLTGDCACDVTGILLTFTWDPAAGKLGVNVRPSADAVAPLAAAFVKARRESIEIEVRRRAWRTSDGALKNHPLSGAA